MLDFSSKYLFLSLMTLILALLLYYKLVPPNYLIGFKEQRILDNKTAWYDINKFFGLQIMKGSFLLAVLSLFTPVLAIAVLNRESTIFGVLILIALFSVYTTKRHADRYFSISK
jgi:uncharacterized membrane protein